MGRVEEIAQMRAGVTELAGKFGLAMKEALLDQLKDLKISRTILSPPKTVFPCAAVLKGGGYLDPCLIVPASLPIELMPRHKSIAVGGQLEKVSRSMFAMSAYMIEEASRAQGYWNGQPLPILVSIGGAYKYLVPQKAFFFKYENYVGSHIDQLSPMEPDLMNLKLGRYCLGDDLSGELTIVIAEY